MAAFWEPLTAISTLALALVTTFLALSTRRLAGNARDEVRANWRPVLSVEPRISETGITPDVTIKDGVLCLTVRNVGRGPALHVSGKLDQSTRPAHRSNEIVAADAYTLLSWRDFERPAPPEGELPVWTHATGAITYLDVAQATYTTEFVIGFAADGRIQMEDVHVKSLPVLPPSGWIGRLSIAYLNAVFDLRRVGWRLARRRSSHVR